MLNILFGSSKFDKDNQKKEEGRCNSGFEFLFNVITIRNLVSVSFVYEIVLNALFVNWSNESCSYLSGFQGLKGGKHSHVTSITRRFFLMSDPNSQFHSSIVNSLACCQFRDFLSYNSLQ